MSTDGYKSYPDFLNRLRRKEMAPKSVEYLFLNKNAEVLSTNDYVSEDAAWEAAVKDAEEDGENIIVFKKLGEIKLKAEKVLS
jgi:hypothetical protein